MTAKGVIAATLASFNIPEAGLLLIIGIDQFLDMGRSATNVIGKRLLQHQAQGELYALQGSLPAAIEQLTLARSAGDGDFYQLSVVDARLKELRAQYTAELKEAKR